ncbi:MAG: hypothetical protein MJ090_04735, partial [Clostridia bacterium]|nr:hypothetical protein [Clostridia bacterium]
MKKTKILSLILALIMIFPCMPLGAISVVAYETTDIDSISAEYTKDFIENIDGYMNEDWVEDDWVEYFRYNTYDNLKLTVNFKNGEIKTYDSLWEARDDLEFGDYEIIDDQSADNQWGIGTHDVKIKLCGKECIAKYNIIENPIKSISAKFTRDFVEKADGWDYFDEGKYFEYDVGSDLKLTVNFKNGEIKTYDSPWEAKEDIGFGGYDIIDDQSADNQWGIGTHDVKIKLCGKECIAKYNIIENPIKSISAKFTRDFVEKADGYMTEDLVEDDWVEYFRYNTNDYDNLKLTVNFKNGEIKTYDSFWEAIDDLGFGDYGIIDDQSADNQWGIGTHDVKIKLCGKE